MKTIFLLIYHIRFYWDKNLPSFPSPFSGAKIEKIYIDDIFGAGGRWKADSETTESCSSRWYLFMGESYLWDSEIHQGIKNRKTPWEDLPFHCFNCMDWTQLLSFSPLYYSVFLAIPICLFWQGSSKSGYVGEASIDLADFAAETKPLTVSLPLKFANSGAVLHVSLSLSLLFELWLSISQLIKPQCHWIVKHLSDFSILIFKVIIETGDNSEDRGSHWSKVSN